MEKHNGGQKSVLRSVVEPVLSLLLICSVSAALLAAANSITKEPIERVKSKSLDAAVLSVLPDDVESYEELSLDDKTARCFKAVGGVNAYAIATSAQGYGGKISVMTGIDGDGKIIAVNVYDNSQETPGLGAKTSSNDFTAQFEGAPLLGGFAVSKDIGKYPNYTEIDAVTGATISSRGVAAAVTNAVKVYEQVKERED